MDYYQRLLKVNELYNLYESSEDLQEKLFQTVKDKDVSERILTNSVSLITGISRCDVGNEKIYVCNFGNGDKGIMIQTPKRLSVGDIIEYQRIKNANKECFIFDIKSKLNK